MLEQSNALAMNAYDYNSTGAAFSAWHRSICENKAIVKQTEDNAVREESMEGVVVPRGWVTVREAGREEAIVVTEPQVNVWKMLSLPPDDPVGTTEVGITKREDVNGEENVSARKSIKNQPFFPLGNVENSDEMVEGESQEAQIHTRNKLNKLRNKLMPSRARTARDFSREISLMGYNAAIQEGPQDIEDGLISRIMRAVAEAGIGTTETSIPESTFSSTSAPMSGLGTSGVVEKGLSIQEHQRGRMMFKFMDKNGDGHVDRTELLGLVLASETSDMMYYLDKDSSRDVSMVEWDSYLFFLKADMAAVNGRFEAYLSYLEKKICAESPPGSKPHAERRDLEDDVDRTVLEVVRLPPPGSIPIVKPVSSEGGKQRRNIEKEWEGAMGQAQEDAIRQAAKHGFGDGAHKSGVRNKWRKAFFDEGGLVKGIGHAAAQVPQEASVRYASETRFINQ